MSDVVVSFDGRDDGLKAAMGGINTGLASLKSAFASLGIAASIAGIGAFVSASIKFGDELDETATKLSISTEALAGFRQAAKLAGVESGGAEQGLIVLQKNLGEAANGSASAQEALSKLGLTVQDLKGISATAAFGIVSDQLRQLGDQSQRTELAMQLFGRGGAEAMAMIQAGSAGLAEGAKQAEAMGTAISSFDAKALGEVQDSIDRAGGAFQAMGVEIAKTLGPSIKMIADYMPDAINTALIAIEALKGGLAALMIPIVTVVDVAINAFSTWGEKSRAVSDLMTAGFDAVWAGIRMGLAYLTQQFPVVVGGIKSALAEVYDYLAQGAALVSEEMEQAYESTAASLRASAAAGSEAAQTEYAAASAALEEAAARGKQAIADLYQASTSQTGRAMVQNLLDNVRDAGARVEELMGKFGALRAAMASPLPVPGGTPLPGPMQGPVDDPAARAQAAKDAEEMARFRERQQQEVQAIGERLAMEESLRGTAEQQNAERIEREQNTVYAAMHSGAITAQEGQNQLARITEEGEMRKQAIRDAYIDQAVNGTATMFGNLSSLMQSENRKAFEIGKVAAIAQTTINTFQSATAAYNSMAGIPYVGPVLGAAAAAAAVAAGMMNINRIRSTQFGAGGGGAPAVPAATAPQGGAAVASGGQPTAPTINKAITINLGDGLVSPDAVRRLIEQINTEVGNGTTLKVA